MVQPKKSILKPLSSIENYQERDSIQLWNRGRRDLVSAGNGNRQAGTTSSNLSRGRHNGRANGSTVSGSGDRQNSSFENNNGDHQHQRSNRAPRSAASAGVTGPNASGNPSASRVQTRSQSRRPPRSKSFAPQAHEINTRQSNRRDSSRVSPRRRSSSRAAEALPTRSTRSSYQNNVRQRAARSSSRASRRRSVSRSPVARNRSPQRDRSTQNTRRQPQPSTPFTRSQSIVRNGKADSLRAKIANSASGPSNAPNRNNDAPGAISESRSLKRSQSAAARAKRNRTIYVDDDDNSQPSTSTAPPPKTSRLAGLNSNPSNERTGNNGSSSAFPCCTDEVDTKFSGFIRICANNCKIEIGGTYRTNGDGEIYCVECFEVKLSAKNFKVEQWKRLKNTVEEKEKTVICQRCRKGWHKCCTLDLQERKFICRHCIRPRDMPRRTTLKDYSKNQFEVFMEKKLNDFLKDSKKFLSVVSYTEEKVTPIEEIVPRPLQDDFSSKYGNSIKYTARIFYLFQRLGEVDVLVFAMTCQEYENILERSWTVIEYLDSVPYAVGRGLKMEAILSYLAWAKKYGFNHAHFFSDPPSEGMDYILHVKPNGNDRNEASLLGYYNALLKKGKSRGTLAAVRTLEDELRRKPYTRPTDILPFVGGLWPSCLKEFDEEIRGKFEDNLPEVNYLKKLNGSMKAKFNVNGKNNFFIDLNLAAKRVKDEDSDKSHKILGDRDEFLGKCRKENWEFGTLRRAMYTSVAVIDMIMEAADQRK